MINGCSTLTIDLRWTSYQGAYDEDERDDSLRLNELECPFLIVSIFKLVQIIDFSGGAIHFKMHLKVNWNASLCPIDDNGVEKGHANVVHAFRLHLLLLASPARSI